MARYRKIDPRIWNDEKFRTFSDRGKLAFMFLLTHPHMTSLGAMRASIPGLAAEIGWSEKAFREAFREAFAKGMVKLDEKACLLWLPRFTKYNRPESPNVIISWVESFDLLPECELKVQLFGELKAYAEALPEGFGIAFGKAFGKAFAKSMPNQEQEQEQEQEEEIAVPRPIRTAPAGPEFLAMLRENHAYAGIDIDRELAKMDAWLMTPAARGRRKTQRFVLNWLNRIDKPLDASPPKRVRPSAHSELDRLDELEREAGAA